MPHHGIDDAPRHNLPLPMPHLSLYQRAFWVALLAAATPAAFFHLLRSSSAPDLTLSFDEADLYDDLFDGELAAAG